MSGAILQQCRQRLGNPPRRLSASDKAAFKFPVPFLIRFFLSREPTLKALYKDQNKLRDHGQIVWGHIVQANTILFQPTTKKVLPAEVIFSPDPYFDDNLDLLEEIAHELFSLKGTTPADPEISQFAAWVTDELSRPDWLPVPFKLTYGRPIYTSVLWIQPPQLPNGYLGASFFPLVICPAKTRAVMILPAPFWPPALLAEWG